MSKKKILLIEPDNIIGGVVSSGLRESGYIITHCRTAQSAINAADKENYDLVICELLLVSHSGIEFLYEFRSYKDWQDVPVMIYSSVPASEFGSKSKGLTSELSIGAYLYKPNTSLEQLIKNVDSLLAVPKHENS